MDTASSAQTPRTSCRHSLSEGLQGNRILRQGAGEVKNEDSLKGKATAKVLRKLPGAN